jgi:formamidopyrimidine-DNA glycosylase
MQKVRKMPELPDVEILRKYMNATALHKNIRNVVVFEPRILENISAPEFEKRLEKKAFLNTFRHGKNLLAQTSGRYILRFHFGMTGFLRYFKNQKDELRHLRLLFNFTNGFKLAYICQRLLGQVGIEDSIDEFVKKHYLGPDALKISLHEFQGTVHGSKKAIKSLLMDQNKISGIGNIYADEVLFQSKVHPESTSKNLGKSRINRIYDDIGKVLNYAIKHKADPEQFGNSYLLAHRKKKGNCPRCDASIKRIEISGRSSYFCPQCQKKQIEAG